MEALSRVGGDIGSVQGDDPLGFMGVGRLNRAAHDIASLALVILLVAGEQGKSDKAGTNSSGKHRALSVETQTTQKAMTLILGVAAGNGRLLTALGDLDVMKLLLAAFVVHRV